MHIYIHSLRSRKIFPSLCEQRVVLLRCEMRNGAALQVMALPTAQDLKSGASSHPTRKKGFSFPVYLSPRGPGTHFTAGFFSCSSAWLCYINRMSTWPTRPCQHLD